MLRKHHVLAASLAALLAAPSVLATECPFLRWDKLTGWETGLNESEVTPLAEFNLKSQLVCAARSPEGSFVFLTKVDSGSRPPLVVDMLDSLVSRESFSDWQVVDFLKERIEVAGPSQRIPALLVSLVYRRGTDGTYRYRKIYIPTPMQCPGATGPVFQNDLLVAHFWGSSDDRTGLKQFEEAVAGVRLPEGCTVLDGQEFETRREILQKAHRLMEQQGSRGSPSQGPPEHGEPQPPTQETTPSSSVAPPTTVDVLLATEADARTIESIRELEAAAARWEGTSLATVLGRTASWARRTASREALGRLLDRLGEDRLAPVVAAEILMVAAEDEDRELASHALRWFDTHHVPACSLPARELRRILVVISHHPGMREVAGRFLRLPEDAARTKACVGTLGFAVTEGQWELRDGRIHFNTYSGTRGAPSRTELLLQQGEEGELYRTAGRMRRHRLPVSRVTSLLDLAADIQEPDPSDAPSE